MINDIDFLKPQILYNILETRYITPAVRVNLSKFCEKCAEFYKDTGNKVEVDIKDCKFNPDTHFIIKNFASRINFTDSKNVMIDSMLRHNSRVEAIKKLEKSGRLEIINIPTIFDIEEILEYISNIDRSKIYRLCSYNELNGQISEISILIAMFIAWFHPTVPIDISARAKSYFYMFSKFWNYTGLVKREAYNILWESNVLKVNAVRIDSRGNNIFYIPGTGEITEDILNQSFKVIPYEFGSKSFSELKNDMELNTVGDSIGKEMTRLLERKRRKKLISELKFMGRETG